MEVSYVLNLGDYSAYQRYFLKHSSQMRPMRLLRWILFLPLIVLFGGFELVAIVDGDWSELGLGLIAGPPLIPLILAMVFWPRMLEWRVRKNLSRKDELKLLLPRKLTLTPDALDFVSDLATSSTRWSAIDRIANTSDHAFIFLTSNVAHIVPRRAFPSEEAFRDFVDMAREYREDALEEESRSSPGSTGRRASSEWKTKVEESFRSIESDERLRARQTRKNPESPEDENRAIPEG